MIKFIQLPGPVNDIYFISIIINSKKYGLYA